MTDAAEQSITAPQGDPAGATPTPEGQVASSAAGQPESAPWYDGFSDEIKGYVETKGWKDPEASIESYRNLEKLVGAPPDQVLRLPKSDADPKEWDSVWNRLGRPAEAKGYEFDESLNLDDSLVEWAQEVFHKNNVPQDAANGILKAYNEIEQIAMQREEEAYTAQVSQEAAQLKKDWGAAFDQNAAQAKAAATQLGMDEQTVDALERVLGFKKTMEFFQGIGSRTGESDFVTPGSSNATGMMTPSAAKSRIAALRADKSFVARYTAHEAGALEEMKRLHEWAYPE